MTTRADQAAKGGAKCRFPDARRGNVFYIHTDSEDGRKGDGDAAGRRACVRDGGVRERCADA